MSICPVNGGRTLCSESVRASKVGVERVKLRRETTEVSDYDVQFTHERPTLYVRLDYQDKLLHQVLFAALVFEIVLLVAQPLAADELLLDMGQRFRQREKDLLGARVRGD
jgi:hypothetical protein